MNICPKCKSIERTTDGKCKPCRKIYMQKFRVEKADTIKASKRAWNLLNAEKVKIQNAERGKRWRELNPEKAKFHADEWAKANPEKAATVKRNWIEAHREEHN